MYQVPVQRLDRIRTSRKRVKEILTDIGLNSCQDFLKDQTSHEDGERCFENTEWNDLTDCYQTKKRRKWFYRTQPLCCTLCWFSCRSWYTFRSHVQRCHEEESDLAALTPCSSCAYVSRPALLARHAKLFHTTATNNGNKVNKAVNKTSAAATQAGVRVTTVGPSGDKYSCAACGYHDSLLYVMRKHVLLNHCKSLLQRYYGCRPLTPPTEGEVALSDNAGGTESSVVVVRQSRFYCCVCKMPAETSEHLLYHLLSSAKHLELQAHIKPLLVEHCSSIARIAPNATKGSELSQQVAPGALQQVVSLVAKGMVRLPHVNGKPQAPKTVMLATHSQPTALVCSAGGGRVQQVLLGGQKNLLSSACANNKAISFMMSSGAQGKQIPVAVTIAGPGPGQTQQVLLPAGLTLSLGGKIGSVGGPGQPLVFSQTQAGKIEVKLTTAGQQMVLTQVQAAKAAAGAGAPQPLRSDATAAVDPSAVLARGKALDPSMVLAPGNGNSFAAMAPNQSLLIGGQVGSVRPVMLNQGLSLQAQQALSNRLFCPVATGSKVGPGQSLVLNQGGLSLQSSQSTVRLIPTGNKVNGIPTFTLAAVQMTVPMQAGVAEPPVLVNMPLQVAPDTPKPSAMFVHTGLSVAAKSQYVVRGSAGSLECLRCQAPFPDQGLYQHLLHGLHCLLCPLVFYSLRQLRSHCDEAHSLALPINRERLRRGYGLAATEDGRLVARTPALAAKVPKDMLGCKELHLALVPKGKDLEVLHLHLMEKLSKPPPPKTPPSSSSSSTPPVPARCPFCQDPCHRGAGAAGTYEQHLRQRHHVMQTIHAILKTPAFKCVYCLGVYTEQSGARTVSIHVQRCRCAPRAVKDAERLLNPDLAGQHNGGGARAGLQAASSSSSPGHYVSVAPEVPAGLELRPPLERKQFLNKYFLKKPYPTRREIEYLVQRLKMSKPEVTLIFSSNRKRCLQDCRRRFLRVLLGFDSSRLKSVKHGLTFPRASATPSSRTRASVTRRAGTKGRTRNAETQMAAPVLECKEEPAEPLQISGPTIDHPYAEPLGLPGSPPRDQNGDGPHRTESGVQP